MKLARSSVISSHTIDHNDSTHQIQIIMASTQHSSFGGFSSLEEEEMFMMVMIASQAYTMSQESRKRKRETEYILVNPRNPLVDESSVTPTNDYKNEDKRFKSET